MPRKYKRVTNRSFSCDAMKLAVEDVLSGALSLRKSAIQHNVKKSTLANYVIKAREVGIENVKFAPNFITTQVFTTEMENSLKHYLLKCSDRFYGLSPKITRRLAYEYAKKNATNYPESWKNKNMAGRDWFTGFMNRNKDLSLRTPEATSIARVSSFNKTNVADFQKKLESLIKKYNFSATDIFNLDETGVTTVQKNQKIISKRGQHQVGKVTSRERGELVTQVAIIGASGIALPPIWIFPRVKFDQLRMMGGVPVESGAVGLVHKTGWMTSDNFLKVLQHFVSNTRCSKDKKVLLIMDNHETHLSVEGIDYCKDNGIVILTLPPHTSNKLQPLDRTVFAPFKCFFNQAADDWMLAHPMQALTIYNLPSLCLKAWDKAATPTNIKSGFRCTGICPFNKNIFTEQDFVPCYQDQNINSEEATEGKQRNPPKTPPLQDVNVLGPQDINLSGPSTSNPQKCLISPSKIMPWPSATKKTTSRKGPPKKTSIIATDTPERDQIAQKKVEKQRKEQIKKTKIKRSVLQVMRIFFIIFFQNQFCFRRKNLQRKYSSK